MTSVTLVDVKLFLLLCGLASWTSLAAFNNLRAFKHGTLYIGFIMGMSALKLPDVPENPLMARAVLSPVIHKMAFALIILVELVVAGLFWTAVYQVAVLGAGEVADQIAFAALAGFMGLAFLLLVSGSWFAYYAHMEQAQLTHFAMIVLALVGMNAI